jgi:hypothetical protein
MCLTPKQIARILCQTRSLAQTNLQAQARPLTSSGSTRPSRPRWIYAARSPRPSHLTLQQTSCPPAGLWILVPARCQSEQGRFGIAERYQTPIPTAHNLSSLIEQQQCHQIAPSSHPAHSVSLIPMKLGWLASQCSVAARPSSRPVSSCRAVIQPSATAASCAVPRRSFDIASRCLIPRLCARTCFPPILRRRSRTPCQAQILQQ